MPIVIGPALSNGLVSRSAIMVGVFGKRRKATKAPEPKPDWKRGDHGSRLCVCGHEEYAHVWPKTGYCSIYKCPCYSPEYHRAS